MVHQLYLVITRGEDPPESLNRMIIVFIPTACMEADLFPYTGGASRSRPTSLSNIVQKLIAKGLSATLEYMA